MQGVLLKGEMEGGSVTASGSHGSRGKDAAAALCVGIGCSLLVRPEVEEGADMWAPPVSAHRERESGARA